MNLPIACTLSAGELRQRKTTLATLRAIVNSRTGIAGGYRYRFAKHSTALQDVSRIAELERQCCRFLDFNVIESETSVCLDVTGKPEAIAIIEDLFG
jgi:hypothetical protein